MKKKIFKYGNPEIQALYPDYLLKCYPIFLILVPGQNNSVENIVSSIFLRILRVFIFSWGFEHLYLHWAADCATVNAQTS